MESAERGAREPDAIARDTIAAVATPVGRGAIGVVRVSGPGVASIATGLLGRLPEPRRATLCTFRDQQGDALDEGVALYFPAPHSYTGEPMLELQGHGGPVVMRALLAACVDAGARLAEPGEFTRRAFLEGKLDLAQAEGVADLIDAACRQAARSALRSLAGEFSETIAALARQLVELRALTEAMIDFPEEEVDTLHREDAGTRLTQARAAIEDVVLRSRRGSVLRSGVHVVIAGRPNVGKSSLLNRLAGEERAIVAAMPGTTRDALRESLEVDGVPLVVVDTAGLRQKPDEIERLGIERTYRELRRADVLMEVFDASDPRPAVAEAPPDVARISVYNKCDLAPAFRPAEGAPEAVLVSALTGAGLDALRSALLRAAGWSESGESVFLARERHLRALEAAAAHLRQAEAQLERWELFAEELRLAHQALCSITGEFAADNLLGEIFSRFCIGK